MTTVAEAEMLIAARMPARPTERVAIEAARGRVLAETVRAERDQPPFDRVTMDGIAIASESWNRGLRRFLIETTQAAGVPAPRLGSPDGCIRVMTGAVRPDGTDAVIPIERVRIDGDLALVEDSAIVTPGRFIHAQGSDRRQDAVVLEPGVLIGPAETAVLASAGYAELAVGSLPRIAIIATGDELVGVEASNMAPHQIRSCNDLAIAAGIERAGAGICQRARLRDDPAEMLARVTELHERSDVLILSGGVSMGEFDFVPAVLGKLGAEPVFHRIAQKPGRPMWFGISATGKPVFALPGNPVSTLLCLTRYVLPALRQSLGLRPPPPEYARLKSAVAGPSGLSYFVPVILDWDDAGTVLAEPRPTNTSGDFASLAATDGFMELSAGAPDYPAGTSGRVHRWT